MLVVGLVDAASVGPALGGVRQTQRLVRARVRVRVRVRVSESGLESGLVRLGVRVSGTWICSVLASWAS